MQIRFTQSARKHRIAKGRALEALANAGEPKEVVPRPGMDDRLLYIGVDDRGLELEIGAIALPDCLLVIHVMPTELRRKK